MWSSRSDDYAWHRSHFGSRCKLGLLQSRKPFAKQAEDICKRGHCTVRQSLWSSRSVHYTWHRRHFGSRYKSGLLRSSLLLSCEMRFMRIALTGVQEARNETPPAGLEPAIFRIRSPTPCPLGKGGKCSCRNSFSGYQKARFRNCASIYRAPFPRPVPPVTTGVGDCPGSPQGKVSFCSSTSR